MINRYSIFFILIIGSIVFLSHPVKDTKSMELTVFFDIYKILVIFKVKYVGYISIINISLQAITKERILLSTTRPLGRVVDSCVSIKFVKKCTLACL